jgi:PAS domain-containing protein
MLTAMVTRIRFRILGIVLLAIIPAVALIWFSAAERKRQMSEEIEGNTLRLSRFLASNLERDLSEGEGFLKATTVVLREKRLLLGECAETLGNLMDKSAVYANLGLSDQDGKILCSAKASPSGSGLGALEWFHKLDTANGFAVGFDFNAGLDTEASIVLVMPVPPAPDAKVPARRYVFAVMDLDWLNQLAESSRLPAGSAISVTNQKGDAVARYPDPDKWVGKSRQTPTDLEYLSAKEGTRVTKGIDGIKRLYAYAKVTGKGSLVVNVGVDREAILEPANRALRNQLVALGAVALLAILAAWFGADVFLLKQVRILIRATKELGGGNLQARSTLSYDSGELGELAKAFDEMAETLEWRNAQLRESEGERADAISKWIELAQHLPEPFLILDEGFRVLAGNAEAASLLDIAPEELAGRPLRDLFSGIPDWETAGLLAESQEHGRPSVLRLRSARRRSRKPEHTETLEISMAKSTLAHETYILVLLKGASEPESQS